MKQTQLHSLCLVASFGLAAPVAAHQGMMGGMNSYAMRMFDADKDGKVTPEEMTAGMQAEVKTYDTDTSGSLSLAEFAAMDAAHTRTMIVRAFQMHDEDGDGRLCCTNPMRDSPCESSVVAGRHEQTHTPRLQDQELARLSTH